MQAIDTAWAYLIDIADLLCCVRHHFHLTNSAWFPRFCSLGGRNVKSRTSRLWFNDFGVHFTRPSTQIIPAEAKSDSVCARNGFDVPLRVHQSFSEHHAAER